MAVTIRYISRSIRKPADRATVETGPSAPMMTRASTDSPRANRAVPSRTEVTPAGNRSSAPSPSAARASALSNARRERIQPASGNR